MCPAGSNRCISPPLAINMFLFKAAGWWSINTDNKILKRLQLTLGRIAISMFMLFVLSTYCTIIIEHDLRSTVTNLPLALMNNVGVFKGLYILCHYDSIYNLMLDTGTAERKVLSGNDDDLKRLIDKNIKKTKRNTITYIVIVYSVLIVYAVQPFIEYALYSSFSDNFVQRESIYSSYVPWDRHAHYVAYYLYELGLLFLSAVLLCSYDTLILALMLHAITQLISLRHKLRRLDKDDDGRMESPGGLLRSNSDESVYSLIDVISEFQIVTRFIKDLNNMIQYLMLMYVCVASLTLCCVVFQATLLHISYATLAKMLGFAFVVMMQLFVLFWYGNEVTVQSALLLESSYDCEWYNGDSSFRKNFLLLRNCFVRQHEFNVGFFAKISLNTFLGILKTTYSVFNILRQMRTTEPEK